MKKRCQQQRRLIVNGKGRSIQDSDTDGTQLPNMWLVGPQSREPISFSNWLTVWYCSSHWLVVMVSQSNSSVIQRARRTIQIRKWPRCRHILDFSVTYHLMVPAYFKAVKSWWGPEVQRLWADCKMTELKPNWLEVIYSRPIRLWSINHSEMPFIPNTQTLNYVVWMLLHLI